VACALLETERLLLRGWRASDRMPFRKINADPRVMEFMPELLSPSASDAMMQRIEEHFERHGFGLFAAEHLQSGSFIGYIGLAVPRFDAPFMPAVEIGWRIAFEFWGQGFATEGARRVVDHAFEDLRLERLVSFTAVQNQRSRRVMEKLGMTHDPDEDFDRPSLAEGHPLRRHVLYRLERPNTPQP
jgi:RimJ/RimL family protein N-acetyltransferase